MFWTSEGAAGGLPYGEELKRKGIHLLSLSIAVGYYLLDREIALMVLLPMLGVSLVLEVARSRPGPLRRWFESWFGSMLRAHERNPGDRRVRLTGATWLLLGAVLTVALFSRPVGTAAIAMLILCDLAAALVGRRWGRKRLPGNSEKTMAGSMACFLTALLVVAATPGLSWPVGLAGAVAATLAEAMRGPLDDNLRIPLLAGAVMTLMSYLPN
jgi:dolichol kinase